MSDDLREALFGKAKPRTPRPHIEAQRMELRSRWAAYIQTHVFSPGDLVKSKPGMGVFADDNIAYLFVRYLDQADPLDQLMIKRDFARQSIHRLDCVIAVLHEDNSCILMSTHDSGYLEPSHDP